MRARGSRAGRDTVGHTAHEPPRENGRNQAQVKTTFIQAVKNSSNVPSKPPSATGYPGSTCSGGMSVPGEVHAVSDRAPGTPPQRTATVPSHSTQSQHPHTTGPGRPHFSTRSSQGHSTWPRTWCVKWWNIEVTTSRPSRTRYTNRAGPAGSMSGQKWVLNIYPGEAQTAGLCARTGRENFRASERACLRHA